MLAKSTKSNLARTPSHTARKPLKRVSHQINKIRPHNTPKQCFFTADAKTLMESLRLYTKDQPILPDFDYVVVGGGSGGISTARRAASYGAKVAVIEQARLGGTCVNVGCIPKKLMWYAANLGHSFHDAESYGFEGLDLDKITYNWKGMKTKRDAYIHRLNAMYYRNSMRDGIYIIRGKAEFEIDPDTNEPDMTTLVIKPSKSTAQDHSDNYIDGFKLEEFTGKEVFVNEGTQITVKVNTTVKAGSYTGSKFEVAPKNKASLQSTANFVVTAPGGYPSPLPIEGKEYITNSDDFFAFEKQPKRAAITGAGYIGVELAQVMSLLGTNVTYVIRRDRVLHTFDHTISEVLMKELNKQTKVTPFSTISRVVKLSGEEVANKKYKDERAFDEAEINDLIDIDTIYGVYISATDDKCQGTGPESFLGYFDTVFSAVGRAPATHIMNIPKSLTNKPGHVQVDAMGRIVDEKVTNVFAIGDAIGKADLTPVAINLGRRLSNFLFGGKGENPLKFSEPKKDNGVPIPTVVFSHPPIGTCGVTEKEAVEIYGKEKTLIWNAKFTPLYCSLLPEENKFQAVTKLITVKEFCNYTQQEEDVIVGCHIMFPGADEAMQTAAIAVVNRLPKSFLDKTVAIHPTAAEELIVGPAGKTPQ